MFLSLGQCSEGAQVSVKPVRRKSEAWVSSIAFMEDAIDKSHNSRALIMITGIIFSIAGFVFVKFSGLKSEKKNKPPERINTVAIANNRKEK
jgi:hypothetical protein